MSMFSIIMPLYNKAPYVKKALESVVAQTCKDWELIVVDDGSTDGSAEIVEAWFSEQYQGGATSLPRQKFRLLRQPNSGVSTARNNGVRAAKGLYICFLDADDWWSPMFLQEMAQLIEQYPDAGIYGCNYYYVKNQKARPMQQGVELAEGESGYINYCQAYAKNLVMPLWTGAVCVSKHVFKSMGGFRPHLKLGEDFDLWIRIALTHRVAFLNQPLAYYNQDMPAAHRATRNLHKPAHHMLFHLDYIEQYTNTGGSSSMTDYKQLIDRLRVTGLLDYWLNKEYHALAQAELAKVDWSQQPKSIRLLYRLPLWMVRFRQRFMRCGSHIKQWLIKHL